jgi:glycerol-3-phosphate cytidylyltransferase
MKKILTVGVFDYFHLGHLRLFKRTKALGEYLIVAVQDETFIKKYKPQAIILYSTYQRMEIIESLRCVDKVIIYKEVDKIVKEVDFDIFVIGSDQNHKGFQKAVQWCKANGKEVIVLERTEGISSSHIKESIKNGGF